MTKIVQFPRTSRQWVIAVISALAGFFFGGAAITMVQKFLRKALYR